MFIFRQGSSKGANTIAGSLSDRLWSTGKADKFQIRNQRSDLEIAQQVSRENTETIARLRAELQRSDTLCSARLKNRDRVVARIREIDAIKTEGKDHEKGPADPLLDRLNGMFGPDGR